MDEHKFSYIKDNNEYLIMMKEPLNNEKTFSIVIKNVKNKKYYGAEIQHRLVIENIGGANITTSKFKVMCNVFLKYQRCINIEDRVTYLKLNIKNETYTDNMNFITKGFALNLSYVLTQITNESTEKTNENINEKINILELRIAELEKENKKQKEILSLCTNCKVHLEKDT